MEYDNLNSHTHPVPSVFIGLPREVSPSAETYGKIAVPSLDRLFGSDWHVCKDKLYPCFAHCSEPAFIGNNCFTPGSTPPFSPTTAGAKRGFIPSNLAGKRR